MRGRLRGAIAALLAGAAVLIGLGAAPAASAQTCTVTVTDTLTGAVVGVFQNVAVPAGDPSQSDLLAALVAAGSVPAAAVDLQFVTLHDGCAVDSPAGTTSTTTSASTTTTASAPVTTTSTTSPPASSTTSTSTTTSGSAAPTDPVATPTAPATTTTTTTSAASPPATGTTTTTTGTPHGAGTTRTHTTSSGTTTTGTTTTTTSSTTTSGSTTTASPGSPRTERGSASGTSGQSGSGTTTTRERTTGSGSRSGAAGGSGNPLSTFGLPGSPTISVPDFFISSFQIPPFLLPIYQAAGIEYQVPWQVLAAINQIETDFGRNLSVSSAGAVGWMQFMPSTWRRWGVDATGSGVADPYNPVDAIFAAARYLHAAGASQSLSRAIFAYNHANWYVQSVLLRAKLIAGVPQSLVDSLTGLVEGRFPVAAPARYADEDVMSAGHRRISGANAADPVESDATARSTEIFTERGAPVIAVNDGKIVRMGHSAALGNYIALQDATGNTYTYAHLGSLSASYAAPRAVRITARDIAAELATPKAKAPTEAATAGHQTDAATPRSTSGAGASGAGASGAGATTTGLSTAAVNRAITAEDAGLARRPARSVAAGEKVRVGHHRTGSAVKVAAPLVKERLFADPARHASYAAGGREQLRRAAPSLSSFEDYFADTLHLARGQYTLRHLKVGSIVIGGTILGRVGARTGSAAPHLTFEIQPAGRRSPKIDPKPILDGWKLLAATDVYRANAIDPFYGPGGKNPTIGQVLLMSKQQLTARVLTNPRVRIYNCGRRDIQAGTIDRRILAVIEYLSASGLQPTVSGLACDASPHGRTGVDEAGRTGESVDISAINGTPVLGHQGAGSITAVTVRRLLGLQGSLAPDEIISDTAFRGEATTLALPDHLNRIQVSYVPAYGASRRLSESFHTSLSAGQWTRLISRISEIPEPVVPLRASRYAIRRR